MLHEGQEPLVNVTEVSDTQETLCEPELLEKQSKIKESASANIETERLRLTENLQESREEMKSLAKEGDNHKMIKGALQVECDLLKEDIKETSDKVSFILSSCLVSV